MIKNTVFTIWILFLIALLSVVYFKYNHSNDGFNITDAKIYEIYHKVSIQTGLQGNIPPLKIQYCLVANAYNTGSEIVLCREMISELANEDELALVLGHEMAHTTLMHLLILSVVHIDTIVPLLELEADKMGAFYMMKAGYDICKGREYWLRSINIDGDYFGKDHPDMAYRYNQLNVMCGKI